MLPFRKLSASQRNIKKPAQFGDMARYYFDSFDGRVFVDDATRALSCRTSKPFTMRQRERFEIC
ncbi:hypothetical protein MPL3356_540010 [Mesorhizobium plurifarium]|uniref:Uncharacterized protein n=1 Tax=Mesorhizobium plurifarium TaxID=69974 RepID=A0A090E6H1_MESPL|nr:hypothetical protein MPL3356_540010 [Mesorhizobium plurifarium]